MRAWTVVLVVFVLVLAPAGAAWCGIAAGQLELAVSGSYVGDVADNGGGIYEADVSVHKLFTAYFSGGVRMALAGIGADTRVMDLWATLDLYTTGSSTSAPYLGAGLGRSSWTINNRSDSTALVEYHIGLKSFVSESTAVNVEVRYEAATEAMGDGFLGVHAGFSVFF